MRPFNAKATCPKCENANVRTQYQPAIRYNDGPQFEERLRRTCCLCRYEWDEATSSAQSQDKP